MENQNKKMLNSIKDTLENHTTQILSNQREVQTKENDLLITNWNNQKKNMEASLKTLNQLTKTTNKILITSQEHNETDNTLMEKATAQETAFNSLIKEAKDTKELMKIMNAATEIIPLINANINNHINTYKQTIQEELSPLPEIEKKIDQNAKAIKTQNTQLKNIYNLINTNKKIIMQKFENTLPDLIKTQFGFHGEKLPQILDDSHEQQKSLLMQILQAITSLNELMNKQNEEELIF
jgi:hypothetical protein